MWNHFGVNAINLADWHKIVTSGVNSALLVKSSPDCVLIGRNKPSSYWPAKTEHCVLIGQISGDFQPQDTESKMPNFWQFLVSTAFFNKLLFIIVQNGFTRFCAFFFVPLGSLSSFPPLIHILGWFSHFIQAMKCTQGCLSFLRHSGDSVHSLV